MTATKENMKLSKADQAAIDSARRIYNIIGARIVDADMNVLGVIDGNGDSEILRDGKASYIQHASGLMSTCGVSTGSAIRLSRSNIVEKDLLMIHQASLEMRLRRGVNVVIDMLDKSFAAQAVAP